MGVIIRDPGAPRGRIVSIYAYTSKRPTEVLIVSRQEAAMAQRRDPEQRSTASAPQPGQAPAKPTGDEIYQRRTVPEGEPASEVPTEEELAELDELRAAAESAYERLSEAVVDLSDRMTEVYDVGRAFVRDNPTSTVVGAFAVGIVVGLLSSGD